MRAPLAVIASALVLVACGGTPSSTRPAAQTSRTTAGPRETRAAPATEATEDTARDAAAQARALGSVADFGALVRAAQALEAAGAAGSDVGCLLRAPSTPNASWRLEADVAVALRPLPSAWEDLDAPLRTGRGAARLLSRWGQTRTEPFALALAAFTGTQPVDPTLPAAAVALTDAGAWVLGTTRESPAARAPVALVALPEAVRAVVAGSAPAQILVTAEASVSLEILRSALSALAPLGAPIALAVPLAPDVRLPPEPVVAPEVMDRGFCGGGSLPEPAADAVEGDLPAAELRAALAPLGEAAARCLAHASGRAASGGRLDLALRIHAEGRIAEACVVRDPILDPALRLCVLAAAQSLRFPAPRPAGFVDLALPLRLAPDAALAQRPLCE
jgi:hypothetical protein